MLRDAARSVGAQIGAAVALLVIVVATIAYVVIGHEQSAEARRAVSTAATTADDVTDPPAGVILLSRAADGRRSESAGAPVGLASKAFPAGASTVRVDSLSYQAYADIRPDGTRVVALADFRNRLSSRDLLWPLVIAAVIGVVGAGGVGGLVGRRAVRPLGRALALQRRFVADASHELRTPLTILHTRAQLLERRLGTGAGPEVREQVGDLLADTRALADVVEDLLLSAELPHRSDRSERVDMQELAAEVVRTFGPHADTSGVTLRLGDAPVEPAVVTGVPVALRRALSSLVDNALAHEHPGGTVTTTVSASAGTVCITVVDDGDGLDPATTDDLLRRFVRANGDAGGSRRFGLGLALVDEVMRAHGGTIGIDGRPGVGARFTLVLPAAGGVRTAAAE
ncbi:MAG: sensor histidine kinase [Mycobacteriales bacterium]